MDPNFISLDKPTTAFDSCGSFLFAADGTNTTRDFASTWITDATSFFNSPSFKSSMMNQLGSNFKIEIVSSAQAKAKGVGCLSMNYSGAYLS